MAYWVLNLLIHQQGDFTQVSVWSQTTSFNLRTALHSQTYLSLVVPETSMFTLKKPPHWYNLKIPESVVFSWLAWSGLFARPRANRCDPGGVRTCWLAYAPQSLPLEPRLRSIPPKSHGLAYWDPQQEDGIRGKATRSATKRDPLPTRTSFLFENEHHTYDQATLSSKVWNEVTCLLKRIAFKHPCEPHKLITNPFYHLKKFYL